MRTDKIRKYLIPNIPYLFSLWAFLKLGTAYRLAAGNDFAHNDGRWALRPPDHKYDGQYLFVDRRGAGGNNRVIR